MGYALAILFVCVSVALLCPRKTLVGRTLHLARIWAPVAVVRTPKKIVTALEASGPVFIKLAQWLSTRRDLLSDELCDEMGELHERVVCAELPADPRWAELTVPDLKVGELLGGGCIAQVFAGELGDAQVAVKVRRTGLDDLLRTDVELLRRVAVLTEWIRPDLQWLALELAVKNFGGYLHSQVDLTLEAKHLKTLEVNLEGVPNVLVPRVHTATETVMVTDLAKGVSLSTFIKERHPDPVRKAVWKDLTDLMARMILKDKFIHGDLHPGNVFVYHKPVSEMERLSLLAHRRKPPRPVITLIDAGIAIEMSDSLVLMARESMRAAFKKDPLRLGGAVVDLHEAEDLCTHGERLEELAHKVGYLMLAGCFMSKEEIWSEVFDTYEEYRGSRVSEYFTKMIGYLSEHKVRVSPGLWSVMTAFALIEGSVAELGYGVSVLGSALPYIWEGGLKGLRDRWSSKHTIHEGAVRKKRGHD